LTGSKYPLILVEERSCNAGGPVHTSLKLAPLPSPPPVINTKGVRGKSSLTY